VDVAEARERRADDIIRRKQEERVRSAIKSELSKTIPARSVRGPKTRPVA
jgi:hypothetical protein